MAIFSGPPPPMPPPAPSRPETVSEVSEDIITSTVVEHYDYGMPKPPAPVPQPVPPPKPQPIPKPTPIAPPPPQPRVETRTEEQIREEYLVKAEKKEEPLPYKPRFVRHMPTQTVAPDQPLRLTTQVDAYPPAQFTWYINGFEVRTTETTRVETEEINVSTLTMTRPKQGKYRVVAKNVVGEEESLGVITVEGMLLICTIYS